MSTYLAPHQSQDKRHNESKLSDNLNLSSTRGVTQRHIEQVLNSNSMIESSTTAYLDSTRELEEWRNSVMKDKFYFLSQQSKKSRKLMLANMPEFNVGSKYQARNRIYLTED
jgi:hypothetical protein